MRARCTLALGHLAWPLNVLTDGRTQAMAAGPRAGATAGADGRDGERRLWQNAGSCEAYLCEAVIDEDVNIHVLYTQPDRASCDVSSSPSAPLAKTTSYAPSRAAREPSRLRQQTLRRDESQVNESGQIIGQMMHGTSTSRPNTLRRGRIERAAVPVFEREGKPSARSGLKYYRRAQASRVPIFSTA